MSNDLHCARCQEPWDSYGARHGDMQKWEYNLFKQGAGCPCCKGEVPEHVDVEVARLRHVKDLVIDVVDDDPHQFALVNDLSFEPPKWEKPEDEVVRKCEHCGDGAVIKKDVEDDHLYWDGKTYNQLYNHGIEWDDAIECPEDVTLNGKFYCPACVQNCRDCGALSFDKDLHLPEGKCRKNDAVCEDCLINHEQEEDME